MTNHSHSIGALLELCDASVYIGVPRRSMLLEVTDADCRRIPLSDQRRAELLFGSERNFRVGEKDVPAGYRNYADRIHCVPALALGHVCSVPMQPSGSITSWVPINHALRARGGWHYALSQRENAFRRMIEVRTQEAIYFTHDWGDLPINPCTAVVDAQEDRRVFEMSGPDDRLVDIRESWETDYMRSLAGLLERLRSNDTTTHKIGGT